MRSVKVDEDNFFELLFVSLFNIIIIHRQVVDINFTVIIVLLYFADDYLF